MGRSGFIIASATLTQFLLGRWISSPWLMPDLALLSILLVVMRDPRHALGPVLFGGCCVMLLTVRHPVLIGLAYAGAGGLVRRLASQWDLTAAPMQRIVVGVMEGLLLTWFMVLSAPVRGGLCMLAMPRLIVTVLCLPLVRAVVVRMLPLAQTAESSPIAL